MTTKPTPTGPNGNANSGKTRFDDFRFKRFCGLILWTAIGLGCAFTVLGFLSRLWWRFELLSHFRVQYLWLLTVCGLILLIGRKFKSTVVPIAFALVNASLVVPLYFNSSASVDQQRTLRAVLVNVHAANNEYSRVIELLRNTNADLAVLIEATPEWVDALKDLRSDYQFSHIESRPGAFGMALYSRIPFQDVRTEAVGPTPSPTIVARFGFDGRTFTLIGTHPFPPASRKAIGFRNRHFAELAKLVRSGTGPIVVLGDLNCSSWSPYFQRLLSESGLRDSRQGFGVQASWPVWMPLLRIPIDHCLVSSGIDVQSREIGTDVGSDHFPVIVEFAVRQLK